MNSEGINGGSILAYDTEQLMPLRSEQKKRSTLMDKYQCTICGYIYDPQKGDPYGSIPPETPFEKLPNNWKCPVCGTDKSKFKKI
jgi:rubredoxin